MKSLATALALLLSALLPVDSRAQAFPDADQATRWFTYYYVKPEPDRLPDALRDPIPGGRRMLNQISIGRRLELGEPERGDRGDAVRDGGASHSS